MIKIRSIRTRLVIAFLLVLIPLAALQVATFAGWRRSRVNEVVDARTDAARVAASLVRNFVLDVVAQNDSLAATIRLDEGFLQPDRLRGLLRTVRQTREAALTYTVTDAEGRIIGSDPPGAEGVNISDRNYFRAVRAGQRWAVSDLVIDRVTGEPSILVAGALAEPGDDFSGVIIARVNTESLSDRFPADLVTGEIVLVDKAGRLVFDSRLAGIPWEERDWSDIALVQEALRGRVASTSSYQSPLTAENIIGTFVPVEDIGWAAGSFLPTSEAMAPLNAWFSGILMAVGVTLLASALLIWILGAYLSTPVRKLTDATTAFAGGGTVPSINVPTGDEIQELADSFNAMKERIIDRENLLEDLAIRNQQFAEAAETRAAELEAVIGSIPVGIVILEGDDGRVVRANAAAEYIQGSLPRVGVPLAEYLSDIKLLRPNGEPLPYDELPAVQAIRERRTVYDQEMLIEQPTGERITILVGASPVMGNDDAVMGAVVVFQDISERKKAEERERTIAEALQDSLMPPLPKEWGGMSFGSKYVAALEEARVGGDFIDVFQLSPERVAVVIGDVSGKGLSAAVEVATIKYFIRAYAYEHPHTSDEILTRVNNALFKDENIERFSTAFIGIIDTKNKTLDYASAGHEPQLILRGKGKSIEELWPTGIALSVVRTAHGHVKTPFNPEDRIVLFTDGATEARSPDGEMLGVEGIKRIVSEIKSRAPEQISEALFSSIMDYTHGKLRDDFALLVAGMK